MNVKENPFNITFGKEPRNVISRENDLKEIYESFSSSNPICETYIISGPRGCGKTVAMTTISENFKKKNDWICVEINPEIDLLEQLASKLYDEGKTKKLFLKVEFNFSFKCLGFSIKGENPVSNISTFINKELEYLKKKDIKVLICIDEVVSNNYVKVFAHEYQSFLRNNFNVFLLMTGLYQNISLLQSYKTLTFLNRAPKVYLNELNIKSIANSYKQIFMFSEPLSVEFAKLTQGYAYAYQLLGSLLYTTNKRSIDAELLDKYDELLMERAYDLIYSELSDREKQILIASLTNPSNEYIINSIAISKSQLANYKKVLYLKGIIYKDYRNKISFSLPRFKEFINFKIMLEE